MWEKLSFIFYFSSLCDKHEFHGSHFSLPYKLINALRFTGICLVYTYFE